MRTRTHKSSLNKGLLAVVGVATLVLASAGPATAQTATVGSGAGTGWEYVPQEQLCGALPSSGAGYNSDEFVLTHVSTYEAVDTSGPAAASYVGPATMRIITGPVTQAPQGAAGGVCPNGSGVLVPSPVTITSVTINGTSATGSVNCTGGSGGTYVRVNTTVAFTFVVECDFTTINGSVQNAPVRHVVEGNQTPCIPFCPPDPVNPDPHAGTPQAASSHMETAFEAEGPA